MVAFENILEEQHCLRNYVDSLIDPEDALANQSQRVKLRRAVMWQIRIVKAIVKCSGALSAVLKSMSEVQDFFSVGGISVISGQGQEGMPLSKRLRAAHDLVFGVVNELCPRLEDIASHVVACMSELVESDESHDVFDDRSDSLRRSCVCHFSELVESASVIARTMVEAFGTIAGCHCLSQSSYAMPAADSLEEEITITVNLLSACVEPPALEQNNDRLVVADVQAPLEDVSSDPLLRLEDPQIFRIQADEEGVMITKTQAKLERKIFASEQGAKEEDVDAVWVEVEEEFEKNEDSDEFNDVDPKVEAHVSELQKQEVSRLQQDEIQTEFAAEMEAPPAELEEEEVSATGATARAKHERFVAEAVARNVEEVAAAPRAGETSLAVEVVANAEDAAAADANVQVQVGKIAEERKAEAVAKSEEERLVAKGVAKSEELPASVGKAECTCLEAEAAKSAQEECLTADAVARSEEEVTATPKAGEHSFAAEAAAEEEEATAADAKVQEEGAKTEKEHLVAEAVAKAEEDGSATNAEELPGSAGKAEGRCMATEIAGKPDEDRLDEVAVAEVKEEKAAVITVVEEQRQAEQVSVLPACVEPPAWRNRSRTVAADFKAPLEDVSSHPPPRLVDFHIPGRQPDEEGVVITCTQERTLKQLLGMRAFSCAPHDMSGGEDIGTIQGGPIAHGIANQRHKSDTTPSNQNERRAGASENGMQLEEADRGGENTATIQGGLIAHDIASQRHNLDTAPSNQNERRAGASESSLQVAVADGGGEDTATIQGGLIAHDIAFQRHNFNTAPSNQNERRAGTSESSLQVEEADGGGEDTATIQGGLIAHEIALQRHNFDTTPSSQNERRAGASENGLQVEEADGGGENTATIQGDSGAHGIALQGHKSDTTPSNQNERHEDASENDPLWEEIDGGGEGTDTMQGGFIALGISLQRHNFDTTPSNQHERRADASENVARNWNDEDMPRDTAIRDVRMILNSVYPLVQGCIPVQLGRIVHMLSDKCGHPMSIFKDDLFSLNEAVFNVPVGAEIDVNAAKLLFRLVARIDEVFEQCHYNTGDNDFAREYVALLGTLQNQPFFTETQQAFMHAWIRKALSMSRWSNLEYL